MQISVRLLQLPAFSTPLKVIENPFFYQLRHFTGSIDVPEKSTIMYLRAKFTVVRNLHQLSQSHAPISRPDGLCFPDCADICDEWQANNIDADLQVHILTTVYGSNVTPNSLRRVLSSLKTEHEGASSIGQLRTAQRIY